MGCLAGSACRECQGHEFKPHVRCRDYIKKITTSDNDKYTELNWWRSDTTMKKIHELEGIAIETTKNEYREKQKVKSINEPQDYFNLPNICVTEIPSGGQEYLKK